MEKLYSVSTIGEGTITHEDQQVKGLSFSVVYSGTAANFIRVIGEEEALAEWATRTHATDATEEALTAAIGTIPPTLDERIAAAEEALLVLMEAVG